MLTIIKEETIGEYKYITYSNGAVVKKSIAAVDGVESTYPTPTEQDAINAAILSKINELTLLIKGES